MVWKFAFNYEIKEGRGEKGRRADERGEEEEEEPEEWEPRREGSSEGNVPCVPASVRRLRYFVISPSINSKWVLPSVATFHLFPSLASSLASTRQLEVLFVKVKGKPAGSENTGGWGRVEWLLGTPPHLARGSKRKPSYLSDYLSKC